MPVFNVKVGSEKLMLNLAVLNFSGINDKWIGDLDKV